MTGRIAACFAALAQRQQRALIPYIVAGDPLPDGTVELMHRLVAAGADVLELGVPFSDPVAEGPVIQRSHERALRHGISLRDALTMVATFRRRDQRTPVLLMGYSNPLAGMGYARFADAAAAAGLDALLTVDMPPEEVDGLNSELKRVGLDNIFLLAPTTPGPRIKKIAAVATGFLYYVSLKGVTGAGHLDSAAVAERLGFIRRFCDLPIAVGFGIGDAATAAAVARVADGVVVGSALVQAMAVRAAAGAPAEQLFDGAVELLQTLRHGIDAIRETA